MMRRYLRIILAVFLGLVPVVSAQTQPSSAKPTYEIEVLPVVESSLQQMWESADTVAEVRIESSIPTAITRLPFHGRERLPLVRTLHTSTVLRVLKGALNPGSTIVFSQQAGEVELSDHIVRIDGPPPLATQQRYVVFLRRQQQPAGDDWLLLGERDGAFKLHDGRVEPQGFGRVAKEHVNLRERAFNDELQRLAARTRPNA